MTKKKIRVLVLEVGKEPELRETVSDLKSFQKIVGGYIQAVRIVDNIYAYCDEEGRLKEKPINVRIPTIAPHLLAVGKNPDWVINTTGQPLPEPGKPAYWELVGDVVFFRMRNGNETSLSDADVKKLQGLHPVDVQQPRAAQRNAVPLRERGRLETFSSDDCGFEDSSKKALTTSLVCLKAGNRNPRTMMSLSQTKLSGWRRESVRTGLVYSFAGQNCEYGTKPAIQPAALLDNHGRPGSL